MSELIDSIKSYLTPAVIENIATVLHEKNPHIFDASIGYATTIFGGIASRANDPEFVDSVFGLIKAGDFSGVLDDPASLLSTSNETVHQPKDISDKVLASVFGNRVPELVTGIASYASIKGNSALSLLGVIGPMLMTLLQRQIESGNLDPTTFTDFLESEKPALASAMPAGIGSAIGMAGISATMHTVDELQPIDKRIGWLLPVLIIVIAIVAIIIWKGCT